MTRLIITAAALALLSTTAFAGTVVCDPTAAYHPTVTDGNGKTYLASYFNNPTCTIGEVDQRSMNLGLKYNSSSTVQDDIRTDMAKADKFN